MGGSFSRNLSHILKSHNQFQTSRKHKNALVNSEWPSKSPIRSFPKSPFPKILGAQYKSIQNPQSKKFYPKKIWNSEENPKLHDKKKNYIDWLIVITLVCKKHTFVFIGDEAYQFKVILGRWFRICGQNLSGTSGIWDKFDPQLPFIKLNSLPKHWLTSIHSLPVSFKWSPAT